jgi:hypothetical protein
MSNVPYFPPIEAVDREKIPPEVAEHIEKLHTHLQLIYDRLQNHYTAIGNVQAQITALQGTK